MRKKGQHGGWRFGAGARPIPEAERLVPLSLRVPRDQLERLIKLDPSGKGSAAVSGREIVTMLLELSDDELSRTLRTQYAKTEAARKDTEARRVWHVRVSEGSMQGAYLVPSKALMRETATSVLKVGRKFAAFDRDSNVEYEVQIADGGKIPTVRVLGKVGKLAPVVLVEPMKLAEEDR